VTSAKPGEGMALFPSNPEVTPLPNFFFSHVLPEIDDPAELRVVLHVFFAIRQKRVFPRYVTKSELLADEALTRRLAPGDGCEQTLSRALGLAVERGIVLAVEREQESVRETLYFINDEPGRRSALRVEAGELAVALSKPAAATPQPEPEPLSVLYEANFGPLTPLIAESIADAQQRYPEAWLARAMKRAVEANVRRWSYVEAILERWRSEGGDIDEETGRDSETERLWQRYRETKQRHKPRR
jgi:DNA replication protein